MIAKGGSTHLEFALIKRIAIGDKAKEEGRRVIAVGTTSCRVLESVADEKTGKVRKNRRA